MLKQRLIIEVQGGVVVAVYTDNVDIDTDISILDHDLDNNDLIAQLKEEISEMDDIL